MIFRCIWQKIKQFNFILMFLNPFADFVDVMKPEIVHNQKHFETI